MSGSNPWLFAFLLFFLFFFFFPWTPAQEKRYGLNEVNERNYFLPEKWVRILFHYFKDKEQILFAENDSLHWTHVI